MTCTHPETLQWSDCTIHTDTECFKAFCATCDKCFLDCEATEPEFEVKYFERALALILDELTDRNAHTVSRLLAWSLGVEGDATDETLIRAYKAAQTELAKA